MQKFPDVSLEGQIEEGKRKYREEQKQSKEEQQVAKKNIKKRKPKFIRSKSFTSEMPNNPQEKWQRIEKLESIYANLEDDCTDDSEQLSAEEQALEQGLVPSEFRDEIITPGKKWIQEGLLRSIHGLRPSKITNSLIDNFETDAIYSVLAGHIKALDLIWRIHKTLIVRENFPRDYIHIVQQVFSFTQKPEKSGDEEMLALTGKLIEKVQNYYDRVENVLDFYKDALNEGKLICESHRKYLKNLFAITDNNEINFASRFAEKDITVNKLLLILMDLQWDIEYLTYPEYAKFLGYRYASAPSIVKRSAIRPGEKDRLIYSEEKIAFIGPDANEHLAQFCQITRRLIERYKSEITKLKFNLHTMQGIFAAKVKLGQSFQSALVKELQPISVNFTAIFNDLINFTDQSKAAIRFRSPLVYKDAIEQYKQMTDVSFRLSAVEHVYDLLFGDYDYFNGTEEFLGILECCEDIQIRLRNFKFQLLSAKANLEDYTFTANMASLIRNFKGIVKLIEKVKVEHDALKQQQQQHEILALRAFLDRAAPVPQIEGEQLKMLTEEEMERETQTLLASMSLSSEATTGNTGLLSETELQALNQLNQVDDRELLAFSREQDARQNNASEDTTTTTSGYGLFDNELNANLQALGALGDKGEQTNLNLGSGSRRRTYSGPS